MTTARRLGEATLRTVLAAREGGRPLLFAHATVHTLDPQVGDLTDADVLIAGAEVVRVGPGLHTAAGDALVVDCTGSTIAPAVIGTAAAHHRGDRAGRLAPGRPATFGVVRSARPGPVERLVWYAADAAAVVADGVVQQWDGRPLVAPVPAHDRAPVDSPHLGRWVDQTGTVHQELTADGRYDETRGGRRHAYQGAFWIEGDHVVYRDDLGFWAYGRFRDGVLHHADFVFRR